MKKLALVAISLFILAGCTNSKKSSTSGQTKVTQGADTAADAKLPEIKYAAPRLVDVIHTQLDVKFDWEKQRLMGTANITLKPYFYSFKEFSLDAQNFDIHSVKIAGSPAKYTYDKIKLTVTTEKEYSRNDTIRLFVEYTAKPNERESKSGTAITSDKGLYFINPTGKEKNKPTQVWTQGEPESNSCWFPTVDKPNERMTNEIRITVDEAHKHFVTLSNGLLLSSTSNPDGSRTDHWKQSLPHAPYLVMMAVGEFAVVKDTPVSIGGKDMEVSYYVEKEYEPHAKAVFGNTPEMIRFFSEKLKLPYPWEKYSQVVVRDYVSGAMENTTAVIHGSFLNQTDRELLDNSYEDVISHELFHHWFGDYVTCEDWSQLTMNEGFATYGEYLWKEYKYGRDAADQIARESMHGYLSSAAKTPKHLVRPRYDAPDDMFDAHSYNKGGAVLHMLRKYVGDEAFFTALQLYLDRNKFTAVETDNLRLTFEQVTGEDLNWFFDQWFHGIGHPRLIIRHNYSDSLKTYYVDVYQAQDIKIQPVFKFPLDIDIYSDGKKERKRFWVNNAAEFISFPVSRKPDLVNVDAEKALLCVKDEKKSVTEWAFQFKNAPLYADRVEALKECALFPSVPEAAQVLIAALNDPSADIRERAIAMMEKLPAEHTTTVRPKLIELAKNDPKSSIRSLAIGTLNRNYDGEDLAPLYRESVKDRSFAVAGTSLSALATKDKKEALAAAKTFESEKSNDMKMAIARLYSESGSDEHNPFFTTLSGQVSGWENVSFSNVYTEFLKKCSDDTINAGVVILERIARSDENRWVKHFGQKGIKDLALMYADRQQRLSEQVTKLKARQDVSPEIKTLEDKLARAKSQEQKLNSLYDSLKTPN